MIPPVEVRQIRPCEDCISYVPGSTSCKMVYMNRRWLSKEPCKYHLTRHEYQNMFDYGWTI